MARSQATTNVPKPECVANRQLPLQLQLLLPKQRPLSKSYGLEGRGGLILVIPQHWVSAAEQELSLRTDNLKLEQADV